jgi:hypothetical protein
VTCTGIIKVLEEVAIVTAFAAGSIAGGPDLPRLTAEFQAGLAETVDLCLPKSKEIAAGCQLEFSPKVI